MNLTANKFLSGLTYEQKADINTIIFEDGRSSVCISGRNVCLSFVDLSFLDILEVIYRLPNIDQIIFDIDYDSEGWSDILNRCLNCYNNIHFVDLGHLIFRKRHVNPFLKHSTCLVGLSLHCVDVDYHSWLYSFLDCMKILNLYLYNFSVPKNEHSLSRQYFILKTCFDKAKMRGTVHISLRDRHLTQLRLKSANSDVGYPFYFEIGSSAAALGPIKYLTTLQIPNCNLTDDGLNGICYSLSNLETLDINACVDLSFNSLKNLNRLEYLKNLHVAFLDVSFNCIYKLERLEFLDVSYVPFPELALMHLLPRFPRLRCIVRCDKFLGQTISSYCKRYLRIILPVLYNDPPDHVIELYCEAPLKRFIRTFNIDNLHLYTLIDHAVPDKIRQLYTIQKDRSRYFHIENGLWVRNAETDIDISVNEY